MATDKKSFIAYSDWHGMFKALPDEVAGKLIKHVFSYVNDENPTNDDYIINALFEQIKSTLKRDLKKWETQREQRSEAGKKSAELRATKSNERSTVVNENVRNSTVSDNVNVNVNDNVIKENINTPLAFSFYSSLIDYGFNKDLVSEWLKVRKTKKLTNTKTAFNNFIKEVEKTKHDKNKIIEECVIKSWGGFKAEWFNKEVTQLSLPKRRIS